MLFDPDFDENDIGRDIAMQEAKENYEEEFASELAHQCTSDCRREGCPKDEIPTFTEYLEDMRAKNEDSAYEHHRDQQTLDELNNHDVTK
jgi:hypothetical protein